MSGMLSVIAPTGNPRRRKGRRKKTRRHVASAKPRRRRRARASNPRHVRRSRRRNRVVRHHRRRHRNPLMGGDVMQKVIQGLTFGAGAIGVGAAAKAVNYFLIKGGDKGTGTPLDDKGLVMLEGAIGVGGFFLLNQFTKGKGQKVSPIATAFAIGAGIRLAEGVYNAYIKDSVVKNAPWLADYQYGQLSDWAPQPGMAAYEQGQLSGGGLYDTGIYG